MSLSVPLYCPNYLCQAPNLETNKFCQRCRMPLPKQYLWMIGNVELLNVGELLADRYLVTQPRIVLDTQPGLLPDSPHEISETIEAYLKLSPYQLHVPQVYGLVQSAQKQTADILLLEKAPIYPEGASYASHKAQLPQLEGTLMPAMTAQWQQSIALRQLNWLWQIAQLWHPLSAQQAASTLLQPELLRVEDSIVRLLELEFDGQTPTLSDLGQLWHQWRSQAQPEIADFLEQLCQQMQQGQIRTAEQLTQVLDQGIAACSQTQTRQLYIATRTDQGPTRQRNEDACYPPSGTVWTLNVDGAETARQPVASNLPLVVVCDGIGGHEGGNVASNLAIDTVQHQLQSLFLQNHSLEPNALISQLEQAALTANGVISQQNDSERRQERQRMGTTLVMALAQTHELYLTHVGDSRAYRVTHTGCHQVTLDDDLAAREVWLGYALYRDALQQPSSGSLVQALGMNDSSLLHPTVQRFVLDQDCLFLLCSDGLSDHDRVEQYWQTELLPVLQGQVDVATASQRLVAIANSKNGHDNVTIGLIYCRVASGQSLTNPIDSSFVTPAENFASVAKVNSVTNPSQLASTAKTRVLPVRQRSANPFLTLIGILLLTVIGGLLGYLLIPDVQQWANSLFESSPMPEPAISSPSATPTSPPSNPPLPILAVGSLIQINRSTVDGSINSAPAVLLQQPPTQQNQLTAAIGSVPAGSVLQISSRQAIANQGYWLKLKVCSVPSTAHSATSGIIPPGTSGWIEQTAIAPLVTQNLTLTAAELGQCVNGK